MYEYYGIAEDKSKNMDEELAEYERQQQAAKDEQDSGGILDMEIDDERLTKKERDKKKEEENSKYATIDDYAPLKCDFDFTLDPTEIVKEPDLY